jgi:hypothetical protein
MRKKSIRILACAAVLALVMLPLFAQQRGGQPGAGAQPGAAAARGGIVSSSSNDEPVPKIPVGFSPIFNGKDLTGWHISKPNPHGTTPDFHVMHGILMGTQNPLGQGGVLLSDKKYRNVEVYMEIKPEWGCDGGLFLHTNEAGAGYEVQLEYLPVGPIMGGIRGEGLQGVSVNPPNWETMSQEQRQAVQAKRQEAWQRAWKREQWNSVRARIVGNPPHITTWINDEMILDWVDSANHAADGAEDGFIGLQIHGGARWRPGHFMRWRVIAVKELP